METKQKILNLGCGSYIKEGMDNADIQSKAPIVFDFNKIPYPIEDDYYDKILVRDVLEHLEKPKQVLMELRRITKHGGRIEIIVPHYSSKCAYDDMEHTHYFSDFSFRYFLNQQNLISKNKFYFNLIELKMKPTRAGKIMPRLVREKMSMFIGGLIGSMKIVLEVRKE